MVETALPQITSVQCREARALLGWTRDRLASHVEVSATTVRKFEIETVIPKLSQIAEMRIALEAAGVEFIAENGGGAGVRLRKEVS